MYSIAIDGPAGAGKSTIAREVSKKLGYIYIDTGAMYRAMALYFVDRGLDYQREETVASHLDDIELTLLYERGVQKIYLKGRDVSSEIRREDVGNAASTISQFESVRAKLTRIQRNLAAAGDVVMDGRDIGTCVLPHADLKIYLTASVSVRAMRRYRELLEKDSDLDLDLFQIEQEIEERDYRDMHRKHCPLKQAEDAVLINSSHLTLEEVVTKILELKNREKEWKLF